MNRFLSILALLFVMATSVAAQGNGNNGNAPGHANSSWANGSWPQYLITWLENGGQIPPLLAADILWDARAWGQQNFGLNYGQMMAKYVQGQLTITYISTAPPSLLFRVSYGGGNTVVLESF